MQLSGGADLEFQSPGHRQTGPSCLRRYVMDGIEVLDARGTLTTEEDNREGAVVYECEGNKVVLGSKSGNCPGIHRQSHDALTLPAEGLYRSLHLP